MTLFLMRDFAFTLLYEESKIPINLKPRKKVEYTIWGTENGLRKYLI